MNRTGDKRKELLIGLSGLGRQNELAVRLLLATCTRKSELVKARWDHVDLGTGLWTIPPELSKNRKAFTIPMPASVAEWFGELNRRACLNLTKQNEVTGPYGLCASLLVWTTRFLESRSRGSNQIAAPAAVVMLDLAARNTQENQGKTGKRPRPVGDAAAAV